MVGCFLCVGLVVIDIVCFSMFVYGVVLFWGVENVIMWRFFVVCVMWCDLWEKCGFCLVWFVCDMVVCGLVLLMVIIFQICKRVLVFYVEYV